MPVAPIQMQKDVVWGDVYAVTTRNLTVLISPEAGEVVSVKIRNGEERLLRPLQLSVSAYQPDLNPAPKWESRAWRTSDGQQVVMLVKNMGPPLSLRVVKLIEVMPEGNAFSQLTRITATGPGDPAWLSPELSIALALPAQHEIETSVLRAAYPEGLSGVHIRWQIEQPESDLTLPLKVTETDAALEVTSNPDLNIEELPPQGWTLLCHLQMVFAVPHPDHLTLEQALKWPPPVN